MRKLLGCLTILLLLTASVPTLSFAAKIKFGHIAPTFHGMSKGIDVFSDYVREKTNGKYNIATFPMGQLGNERSMASQVQSGSLQIAAITHRGAAEFCPGSGDPRHAVSVSRPGHGLRSVG